MTGKREKLKITTIVPGNWEAELLHAGSVHLGGAINQSLSPHAIEFSFMTLPAFAQGPGKIGLPAVIVLMAPANPSCMSIPGHSCRTDY